MILSRPKTMPTGPIKWVDLEICSCEKHRGPLGGVCGACGGAIPTESEFRVLEETKRRAYDKFVRNRL